LRSPSTFDGLRDELANVRAAGYAESHDEAVPGVGSTAVAISDRDGSEMLGICVSYPASGTSAHEKALIARTMLELIDATASRAGEPIRVMATGSTRNVMKNV
jgi:DNA-binding IclR family transcriptional regulator